LPEAIPIEPTPSRGFNRVLQRAAWHVESSGKEELRCENVLVAIFAEADSTAAHRLLEAGRTRLAAERYLSHGGADTDEDEDVEPKLDDGQDEEKEEGPLDRFAVHLNAQAEAGEIEPLIGREKEVRRLIQVLARRKKNNPVLVGDAGVGKTAIVEGLARLVHEDKVPSALKDAQIYALDLGSLVAGTKFRGDFENRMKAVIKRIEMIPGSVLFVDEMHTIVGAGATSGG